MEFQKGLRYVLCCCVVSAAVLNKVIDKDLIFLMFQGKFQATVVCWLLGLGSLVAWNSMLTLGDYYTGLFKVGLV